MEQLKINKPETKKNLLIKMVVLGNYNVGKTNIVKRVFNKNFEEHSLTTIGIEFATLEINDQENTSVYIQVWDTCKFFIKLVQKNIKQSLLDILEMQMEFY